jgi:hypothetical protein
MWIPYMKWVPQHKGFDPGAFQANYYEEISQYHDRSSDTGSSSVYNPYSVSGGGASVKSPFRVFELPPSK